jgi:aspartyl-tRNA(Asn)/glutamyl-tRNA(Gln) amidotransferase subunit C
VNRRVPEVILDEDSVGESMGKRRANLTTRDQIGKAGTQPTEFESAHETAAALQVPCIRRLCYVARLVNQAGSIMSLDASDIEKIAHLARLAIAPESIERYAADLSNILELVAQMDAVDTTGVEPMAHPLHMSQRLRPDRVSEPDRRELFQEIAPLTEDGLYLVPKVID